MIKVFLKDLFSKSQVVKYLLAAFLLYYGLDYYLKNNQLSIDFNIRLIIYIMAAIIFTIYFFIKTYTSRENIGVYYSLPATYKNINTSFIGALILDTLFRKILIICIFLYMIKAPLDVFIIILALTPITVIIGSIPCVKNISAIRKIMVLILSLLGAGAIILTYMNFKIKLNYLIYLGILLIYLLIIRIIYLKDIEFGLVKSSAIAKIKTRNYFFKFVIAENVYIVNTLAIIAMVIFLNFLMPDNLRLAMTLAVATVNTPIMTIFSTDEKIGDYKKMLPSKYKSLDKDYLKVLFTYFLLIHLLILGLNINNLSLKLILGLAGFVILDTGISFYLEKNHPIKGKKTTIEIWRSPRKYILGCLVFLLAFLFFVIF